MSLRDAIRDAVDERNKQSESDAALANPDSAEDEQAEDVQAKPIAPKAKATRARAPKPSASTSTRQRLQTPSIEIPQQSKPNTASNKAVNTASSKAVRNTPLEKSADDDEVESIETAALTVRVPRSHRIHWLISAKKEGTSLTAAITEALNARFGEPND
ncbi:hypothetical protein EON83_25550 [bacterium]|nr:MAG: hypothetical protein EON83_25550 [bacterium]